MNTNRSAIADMRRVSEYSTRGGGDRNRGRGGRNSNRGLARSYSPEEWQNLSAEERARIYRARENSGGRGRPGGGRGRGGGSRGGRNFRGRGRGKGNFYYQDDHSTQTRQTSAVQTDGGGDNHNDPGAPVPDDVSEITRTTVATNRIEFNNSMKRRRLSAIYTTIRGLVNSGA